MHSCPICDEACYCGGDFEDTDVGDEEAIEECTHCGDGPPWHEDDDYEDFDEE